MPFPFFRLPLEIRYMIYQHLFIPADNDTPVTPDIRRFHCEFDKDQRIILRGRSPIALHCQALSLIRTCQQAHEEGTIVLYGQNTFHFSDTPYFKDSPYFDDKPEVPSGVVLPFCELTYMYAFLSVIGKANRLRIRHLVLLFGDDTFITFPGEHNVWILKRFSEMGGANYISDALDFLSENHRLQSLRLHFEGLYGGTAGFSVWFSEDSRLARKLAQFRGIEELECLVHPWYLKVYRIDDDNLNATYEKAVKNYEELKVKLEAAYPLESGQPDSSSTKRRFQSDPVSQHEASSPNPDEAIADILVL